MLVCIGQLAAVLQLDLALILTLICCLSHCDFRASLSLSGLVQDLRQQPFAYSPSCSYFLVAAILYELAVQPPHKELAACSVLSEKGNLVSGETSEIWTEVCWST